MILREEQAALFQFGFGVFLCHGAGAGISMASSLQGWLFPVDKEAENQLAQEGSEQRAARGIFFPLH